MNVVQEPKPVSLEVTYDDFQHCSAIRMPHNNQVSMDCPYTAKGEEFSPLNLTGVSLAGCMLLSMGTLAIRDRLDISGTKVDVQVTPKEKPTPMIDSIDLTFKMARDFSEKDRFKLERAAGLCPIKPSLHPDVTLNVSYTYPE